MYFPGLYPEYVKDYRVFTDPNNTQAKFSDTRSAVNVNVLGTATGTLTAQSQTFLCRRTPTTSAPPSRGRHAISTGSTAVYVPRYQSSWTNIDMGNRAGREQSSNCDSNTASVLCGASNENLYTHQLRWKNPPSQTYVTSTTYHVPQTAKVLVSVEHGVCPQGRREPVPRPAACPAPAPARAVRAKARPMPASTAPAPARVNFWKLDPTGP